MTSNLESKLAHLPDQPGVYLFKDQAGELLYVGKAAVLSNRVRSYFKKGTDHSRNTPSWSATSQTSKRSSPAQNSKRSSSKAI